MYRLRGSLEFIFFITEQGFEFSFRYRRNWSREGDGCQREQAWGSLRTPGDCTLTGVRPLSLGVKLQVSQKFSTYGRVLFLRECHKPRGTSCKAHQGFADSAKALMERCRRRLCAHGVCLSFFAVCIWRPAGVTSTALESGVYHFKRWKNFVDTELNETCDAQCLITFLLQLSPPVQVTWRDKQDVLRGADPKTIIFFCPEKLRKINLYFSVQKQLLFS